MKNIIVISLSAIAICLTGCTENERAKSFGGTMTVNAPAGKTVVNMTWKEAELWVQYRDRRPDEKPTTHTFKEYSSFGMVQGTVIVNEK
jgi:hypothetical protein